MGGSDAQWDAMGEKGTLWGANGGEQHPMGDKGTQ